MSGELNQISVELGKLMAKMENLEGKVTLGLQNFEARQGENSRKLDELTSLKNKGAGLLFGVSIMAGAIGSFIHFLWDYFKGAGH